MTVKIDQRGLVLHMTFDSGTIEGSTVKDLSAHRNHGTIYGATSVDGKFGKALSFDGEDDYMEVPYHSSLTPSKITVATWVKPTTLADAKEIVGRGWNKEGYTLRWNADGSIDFMIGNGVKWYGEGGHPVDAVTEGAWYFVVGVFDENTAKLYVNAEENWSEEAEITRSTSTLDLRIGDSAGDPCNRHIEGIIDEVRIYNRALSAEEIALLYNTTRKRIKNQQKGLVLYLPFDSSTIAGSTAKDLSAYRNNGTIYGATPTTGKYGEALSFDGENDYIDVGTLGNFGSELDSDTISFWLKTSSTSRITTVHVFNAEPSLQFFGTEINSNGTSTPLPGSIYFQIRDTSGNRLNAYTGDVGVNNGGWHHVVITENCSTNEIKIYLDGTQKTVTYRDQQTPSNFVNFDQNVPIGARRTNSGTLDLYYDGILDEPRIYNRILSADEIALLYNAGRRRLKIV